MRILFYGKHDWANMCNRIARAINQTGGGHEARVCTAYAHPFGYREDMVAERGDLDELAAYAEAADWIISTGDGEYAWWDAMVRALPLPATCRRATIHIGSAYRNDAAGYEGADRERGFNRRFVGADLYRLARSPAIPFIAAAEDFVEKLPDLSGPIRIGHSPSNRKTKGTNAIMECLARTVSGRGYVELIEGVSYLEAAQRRSCCGVFVDQMNAEIGGFGASSVEALAAGCAVLADYRQIIPSVWDFVSRPPIVHVGSEEDLVREVRGLMDDGGRLHGLRSESLAWAREHAAPGPLARWWLGHLA